MKNKVVIYTKETIDELNWTQYTHGVLMKDYFRAMFEQGTEIYVKNINTTVGILAINDHLLPFTVNEKEYENSYVCSPYNHYITYAKEELKMLKKPTVEWILRAILNAIGVITKVVKINKVVYVNNWLISTNLFVQLKKEELAEIKKELLKRYPDHLIGYRSVNEQLHPNMKKACEELGFMSLPSRYVYISSPKVKEESSKKVRNTLKRDAKLLENADIDIIHHEQFTKEDIERVGWLYQQLYLDKYSYQNPQFSDHYILRTHEKKTLTYMGIKINGQLEGVFASMIFEGMMANPIVGYNTHLPKETGMYRMLRLLALEESVKHHRIYHQSAGVGRYKYDRGAKGFPEYTMIYIDHLSQGRKLFWKSLSALFSNYAIKLIEKNKL